MINMIKITKMIRIIKIIKMIKMIKIIKIIKIIKMINMIKKLQKLLAKVYFTRMLFCSPQNAVPYSLAKCSPKQNALHEKNIL